VLRILVRDKETDWDFEECLGGEFSGRLTTVSGSEHGDSFPCKHIHIIENNLKIIMIH
jgi:hypothetical protein